MATTEWIGDPPDACCACEAPIEDAFADAVVPRSMGGNGHSWGPLCTSCALVAEVHLGIGRGQYYRRDKDTGRFLKVR